MKGYHLQLVLFLVLGMILTGCSGGSSVTTPDITGPTGNSVNNGGGTGLLGYYTVYIDVENQVVEAVPNRDVMYAVNVNHFLNLNPMTLSFNFNSTTVGPFGEYIDVDLDVTIGHPIPGATKFNGYDVRGVMIGDGSGIMAGNPEIKYPILGIDQYLMNADGYTRWWNKQEFFVEGLFGYTPGLYGSKNLVGTATMNGYKYFADGLAADEDAWSFLQANPGVFSSGSTNTRNYVIRFPLPSPGIQYDYAILADWSGGAPEDHPSPATEAVVYSTTVHEGLTYSLTAGGSGDLVFDLGLLSFGDEMVPSGVMVEASVLSEPYYWDLSMTEPIEIGDNYAVWRFQETADNILTTTGNEMILGVEYGAYDYSNPFDIPNDALGSPLTAYFRAAIPVEEVSGGNLPPEILSGVDGDVEAAPTDVKVYDVTAVDPDMDPLTYDWTVTNNFTMVEVFSGPGDGMGGFTVDWAGDVGAADGDEYMIDCEVSDGINPPVSAVGLIVLIVDSGVVTLYLYDGELDDGGITNWDDGFTTMTWEYCPGTSSWDENECGPYFTGSVYAICYTPYIEFPASGEYSELHLEIWHWGDMQDDGACYGSPGIIEDDGDIGNWQPNWNTEALTYIEGFDFNDGDWADWSFVYGSEETPEWSHFDCSAYEGLTAGIGFQFEEYGAANPDTQDGFNVRKVWVYYVP